MELEIGNWELVGVGQNARMPEKRFTLILLTLRPPIPIRQQQFIRSAPVPEYPDPSGYIEGRRAVEWELLELFRFLQ